MAVLESTPASPILQASSPVRPSMVHVPLTRLSSLCRRQRKLARDLRSMYETALAASAPPPGMTDTVARALWRVDSCLRLLGEMPVLPTDEQAQTIRIAKELLELTRESLHETDKAKERSASAGT